MGLDEGSTGGPARAERLTAGLQTGRTSTPSGAAIETEEPGDAAGEQCSRVVGAASAGVAPDPASGEDGAA